MPARFAAPTPDAIPVHVLSPEGIDGFAIAQTDAVRAQLAVQPFTGKLGEVRLLFAPDGSLAMALAGLNHVVADYHAAIGGTPPERVVGVWLIANSLFQRGVGACRYRDIALVDGTDAVTPVPIG